MNDFQNPTLTRREALGFALSMSSFVATRGVSGAARAEGAAPPKIGCGTVCFRKLPLEEALRRIRRAGYEYFETQATGPWCPHVDPWKDDPQKFRQTVERHGFKGVTGLWAAHGAIIPDAKSVAGICQTIRWAKEAGIPLVFAGDGKKPGGMSDEDALRVLGERLSRILKSAEANSVHLGIEPHGTFSLTADGLRKIMGLSSSRWLGINYDTANVHRATYVETVDGAYSWMPFGRRQDEVATLRAVADKVVHVHVKDVSGAKCVALGEGKVNVQGCLRVLREGGYTGVLSLETEGDSETEEGQRLIESSRKYLVDALAKI